MATGYVRHNMPQFNTMFCPASLVYPARVIDKTGCEFPGGYQVEGRAGHLLLSTDDGDLADRYCAHVNGALVDRHEPDAKPYMITVKDGSATFMRMDEKTGRCAYRTGPHEADEDAVVEAILRQDYSLTDISPDGW